MVPVQSLAETHPLPLTLGDQRKRQTLFQAIQADFFCTCIEIIAPACGHRNIWL